MKRQRRGGQSFFRLAKGGGVGPTLFIEKFRGGGCSLRYILRVVHCPGWVLCKVTILQLYVSWILIITNYKEIYEVKGGVGHCVNIE